ncbi:MAG: hypothetical protein MR291_01330 [Oscillospiraceae bacterium]|nr:hypothetical protein [Oscillospiraceae bacterium]
MIPDKVGYTRGEKAAEIVGGALLAVYSAVIILLMILGITGGENIILLVVMLIGYGILSICSTYPQGSNVISHPEKATDLVFHRVRWGCIVAKYVLSTVIFILSLPFFSAVVK